MAGFTEYSERGYRGVMAPEGLVCYQAVIGESDLYICTATDLSHVALKSLEARRRELEGYLSSHMTFGTSFRPVPAAGDAPGIARDMAEAAEAFDVGPMASVAGAIAQWVGQDLLGLSSEVIVENGGDIFLAGGPKRAVRVFAGAGSPALDLVIEPTEEGIGVCTSSGMVGPSVSLGAADSVTVIARTATIADAAATALGNIVLVPEDIAPALEKAASFEHVLGAVLMLQGSVGAWGKVELA